MPAPTVHIATSAGGHVELVTAVRGAFAGYRRVWVVQPSLRARALAAAGEKVVELPDYDRHPLRGHHLRNIARAAAVVLRDRPQVVVTPGAGSTVAFCAFARLLGARIVFVETMARVSSPSASGRVLARLASRVLVQWPELAAAYPRATVCRPALLRAVPDGEAAAGEGVFVGVGTHSQPFDRLLEMVDRAAGHGVLPAPVVVQGGPSTYRARHVDVRPWLEPDEVSAAIARARYVVCHGGSGLVSGALRAGRRPMVLARLAQHGEHYDDHQAQIVSKLADLGLAVPLRDEIRERDLAAARAPLPPASAWALRPDVEDALRAELEAALGPPAADAVASPPAQRRIA
jgi:UDP-N-acetylglucosamine--N-acetylmuramyl-(pentapeptide) pyrophosphoryl-undecaprenol N-acetylglucosamine transferase